MTKHRHTLFWKSELILLPIFGPVHYYTFSFVFYTIKSLKICSVEQHKSNLYTVIFLSHRILYICIHTHI